MDPASPNKRLVQASNDYLEVEVEAERATDCLVLMTPHQQAQLGLQALLVQQYKEAGYSKGQAVDLA